MENFKLDQDTIFSILLVATAFLAMKYLPRLMAGVPFVPVDEVKQRMDAGDEIVVVDVRTAGEFTGNLGHIPGAVNLPLSEVSQKLRAEAEGLAAVKGQPVYVTCRTDNRAPRAARMFRQAGFTDVKVISGGIKSWNRKGFEVEGRGV